MSIQKESPYVSHVFVCTNDRGGERRSCADNNSQLLKTNLKSAVNEKGCVKGYHMHKSLYSEDRIKKPSSGPEREDRVLVTSPQGQTRVTVNVTEDITPGVTCLHQGQWVDLDAAGVDTGGAANVLTSTVPTLPSHGSRTHTTFVEVTRYQEA